MQATRVWSVVDRYPLPGALPDHAIARLQSTAISGLIGTPECGAATRLRHRVQVVQIYSQWAVWLVVGGLAGWAITRKTEGQRLQA